MIIFTRIPRTGGTTFWRAIEKNFNPEKFWQKGKEERFLLYQVGGIHGALQNGRQLDVAPDIFMGHFPHGVHKLFPTNDYKYITFLRYPVDRTISLIRYAMTLGYDKEYEDELQRTGFFEHQLFLQDYLRDMNGSNIKSVLMKCIEKETICNLMTKQLSGMEDFNNIMSTYSWKWLNYYPVNHTNKRKYSDMEMRMMLDVAKYNIENNYDFVGFQERGREDHLRACKQFGWEYASAIPDFHVSAGDDIDWQDKEVNALLHLMNEHDIQLYNFAKGLYS